MNSMQTIIHDLLVEYQQINQRLLLKVQEAMGMPDEEIERQVVEPSSDTIDSKIPTFDQMQSQRLTDMLWARFEYAGAWKLAEAGIEWLSLKQIQSESRELENIQMINDATSEDSSLLFGIPLSQISLFGIHPEQGEAIFLIWPAAVGGEPAILSQSGNFENHYPNLEQYLRSLIRDAKKGLQE